MVMYAYEVQTKQKEKLPDIKKKPHHICFDVQVQNTEYMICGSKSGWHVEIIVKELQYEEVSPYRATNITNINYV